MSGVVDVFLANDTGAIYAFLNVVWVFMAEWRIAELHGPAFGYALWNAMFAVPVRFLEANADEYGRYREMDRTWWIAHHAKLCVYLPDLLLRTSALTAKYFAAFLDAAATTVVLKDAQVSIKSKAKVRKRRESSSLRKLRQREPEEVEFAS
ncbi:hypothetical protein PC128_g18447 [Phytophthora cactorum]|nr:hypothetical protein PC128_g18447 [Phytophthora cactorum]